MNDATWSAATFEGTTAAQSRAIAVLTPTERVALLERLLELAATTGALQIARDDKQRALDAIWSPT